MTISSRRRGFTLIELLTAMAIIAVLASIAIKMFWHAKDGGLESAVKSDLKTAAVQQEWYFERNGVYAASVGLLSNLDQSPGVTVTITHAANDGWAATAAHVSLYSTLCGLIIGDAPAGVAGPATLSGIVTCTN